MVQDTALTAWHLGYIIGIPVLVAITASLLLVALILRKKSIENPYEDWFIGKWIFYVATGIFALVTLSFIFPFDAEYHQYKLVEGKVERVESRMQSDGNGSTEKFVAVVGSVPYRIDDSRGALIRTGDDISLWCSKIWQYKGEAGWVCDWGG